MRSRELKLDDDDFGGCVPGWGGFCINGLSLPNGQLLGHSHEAASSKIHTQTHRHRLNPESALCDR